MGVKVSVKAATLKLCLTCRCAVTVSIGGRCIPCSDRHERRMKRIKERDAEYQALLRKHNKV